MADEFDPSNLLGWAGEDKAEEVWSAMGSQFPDFMIVGADYNAGVDYRMLFELNRKVLGKDTPNWPQQTSDCVPMGAKNVIEYVSCQEIAAGEAEEFHPIYVPYLYATGRVLIGQGQLRGQGGSVGSWQAKAVEQYGVVRADLPGLPAYSGKLCDQWGNQGPPKEYIPEGKQHLIQTTSRIRDWDALVQANVNYYPATIASNQGFEMMPRKDGFHYPKGSWPHQMAIVGICNDPANLYACVLNSWGDVHGVLKDLRDPNVTWPKGTLRVRRETIERMLRTGECFLYSRFQGFKSQTFDARQSV